MAPRKLGRSSLEVAPIVFGTATFGGDYPDWGTSDVTEARRLIDMAIDGGVTMFDTADVYSAGRAEVILGAALGSRRNDVLIASKVGMRVGDDPSEGLAAGRIRTCCEASLRRIGRDHIDLYQIHAFDALTDLTETMEALDRLVGEGKVRAIGISNFSGWHVTKALAIAARDGLAAPVVHQAYYSLIAREYEWELMPVAYDQGLSTLVYSPLGGARLSGKIGRTKPEPIGSRAVTASAGPGPTNADLYRVTDALELVAAEGGWTIAQVALAWCLTRPTVAGVVIGARSEAQLRSNLRAGTIALSADQIGMLDRASNQPLPYPYWHQRMLTGARNPHPCDRPARN